MSTPEELVALMDEAFNDPDVIERVVDAVRLTKKLTEMSGPDLVDLALQHIKVAPLVEIVLFELCTRVDPNWSDRDPAAPIHQSSADARQPTGAKSE